jgi:hypothetical protein
MILLKQLKQIKVNGPEYLVTGICDQVDDDFEQLPSIFALWSEFSGNIDYPVPHPTLDPVDAFCEITNLWIGEYGEARKRLLDFCIAELEKSK